MAGLVPNSESFAGALCALSLAADLNMGQPMEHGLRSVWIANRIAERAKLSAQDRVCVYYGGLLKDAG